MQEAVLGFMTSSLHEHFTGNKVGTRPFRVADGYFSLRTSDVTDEGWATLANLLGRDDVIEDARFATPAARRQHAAEIDAMVRGWASQKTRQEVWDGLRDLGYFGAPVLSIGEVMQDPHIKERGAFVECEHPTAGRTTLVAPWIHLSGTPTGIHDQSPALGEHTDEVLGGILGLAPDELRKLHAEGAVQ